MNKDTSAILKLTVTNPAGLGRGTAVEHCFGINGGSIGTATNDTWQLSPHRTGAVAGHAEVRFVDSGFCLIDRSGRTFINSASQPVGRGRRARLSHGDTLTIGRYRMRAELNGDAVDRSELEESSGQDRQLAEVEEDSRLRAETGQRMPEGREPLEGLHEPAGEPVGDGPLAAVPGT